MIESEMIRANEEREQLQKELIQTIQDFANVSNQSMYYENIMTSNTTEIWNYLNEIPHLLSDSLAQIKGIRSRFFIQSCVNEKNSTLALDKHTELKIELESAKNLSKSILNHAEIIRKRRVVPLLDVIWNLTNKSANTESLLSYNPLLDSIYLILKEVESKEIALKSLGILVNISANEIGKKNIRFWFVSENADLFKVIFDTNDLFCDPQIRQLSMFFFRNFVDDDEICLIFIRNGCFQYFYNYIADIMNDVTLLPMLNSILKIVLQKSFCKTIEKFAKNEVYQLEKLYLKTNADFVKLGFKSVIEMFEENSHEQTKQIKRFGISRIYSKL